MLDIRESLPDCLLPYGNGYVLVMEDFGGIALSKYTQTHTLKLLDAVAIALQIAEIYITFIKIDAYTSQGEFIKALTDEYRLLILRPEHGMSDAVEQENWKKNSISS